MRVPLSMTRWHLHTDICLPRPMWDRQEWGRVDTDGRPLFGPESAVAEAEQCQALGGRFAPAVFGWMAHAYVYAEDPDAIWKPLSGHGSGHAHHQ